MVQEIWRQGQAFMGGHPETNTNSNSTDEGSKSQAGRTYRVTSEGAANPALSGEYSWGWKRGVATSKTGNPYLPAGVPRYPRHSNTVAGYSSSPRRAVRVVVLPFWSALLSKLDNDAMAGKSAPFCSRMVQWGSKYLVPMKLFPLKEFKASSASFWKNVDLECGKQKHNSLRDCFQIQQIQNLGA